MSEITEGNMITLEAIASRWHVSEERAAHLVALIPTMTNPDGVEYWLHDGIALWPAGEAELAEDAFPELERGEADKVEDLLRRMLGSLEEFGSDRRSDIKYHCVEHRAEKNLLTPGGMSIADARESAGFSVAEAASRSEMTEDHYLRIESGRVMADLNEGRSIASALGVGIADISFGRQTEAVANVA